MTTTNDANGIFTNTAEDEPTTLVVAGETLPVIYDYWGVKVAQLTGVEQLDAILEAAGYECFVNAGIHSLQVGEGRWSERSAHAHDLEYHHRERKQVAAREKAIAVYRERFDVCRATMAELPYYVKDDVKLASLAATVTCELELQGVLYAWRPFNPAKLNAALKDLEHKLEWLLTERNIVMTAIDLAEGRIENDATRHNRAVVERLQELQIRSEGLIEAPDAEVLTKVYEDRLRSHGRETIRPIDLYSIDLRIQFEDYAPDDILSDPTLELLAESIEIDGKTYPVAYRYIFEPGEKDWDDGEWIASGIVEVPISLYRRLAPAYAKPSGFPELPGDVRMFLRIMKQEKRFTSGFDTLALAKKVEKMEKGQNRQADLVSSEGPTAPPPWCKSKHAGRRR